MFFYSYLKTCWGPGWRDGLRASRDTGEKGEWGAGGGGKPPRMRAGFDRDTLFLGLLVPKLWGWGAFLPGGPSSF